MKCGLFLILLFISCKNNPKGQPSDTFQFHSAATGDNYQISFRKPAGFHPDSSYHFIFVADGTIGTGEYFLGTNPEWKADLPGNCLVVTIGHIGDYHAKRRRDFIPADISKNKENDFGQAHRFYSFLKTEFLPHIKKQFPNQEETSFVGHSFSGLFCLYAALRNEGMFDHYFAISPSVWANGRELMDIETEMAKTTRDLKADIHIYAGSLEFFNKVLFSSRAFYKQITERNYPSLKISIETIGGANHFSVRKPAIDRILAACKEK
jgi:hypothetical protein